MPFFDSLSLSTLKPVRVSTKHSIACINKAVILEATYRIFRHNTKEKYPFKTSFNKHTIQGARRRPLPHEHMVKHVQPRNIFYDISTNSSRSFRIHMGKIRQIQQINQRRPQPIQLGHKTPINCNVDMKAYVAAKLSAS